MAIVLNNSPLSEQLNVLLIGNNPIELSSIYERLKELKDRTFIAEIAFDVNAVLKGKKRFRPSFILIDDNIGKKQINEIVRFLRLRKDTEHIPITVIKNSNYVDSAEGVQEFILKQNADGETIAKALMNSVKFKRTQEFLYQSYYKNKKRVRNILKVR